MAVGYPRTAIGRIRGPIFLLAAAWAQPLKVAVQTVCINAITVSLIEPTLTESGKLIADSLVTLLPAFLCERARAERGLLGVAMLLILSLVRHPAT